MVKNRICIGKWVCRYQTEMEKGDVYRCSCLMNIDRVTANEKVTSDIGKIAFVARPYYVLRGMGRQ